MLELLYNYYFEKKKKKREKEKKMMNINDSPKIFLHT